MVITEPPKLQSKSLDTGAQTHLSPALPNTSPDGAAADSHSKNGAAFYQLSARIPIKRDRLSGPPPIRRRTGPPAVPAENRAPGSARTPAFPDRPGSGGG